jgi:hypothetical protein
MKKPIVSALLLCTLVAGAQETPVELGRVDWLRDLDVALARAERSQKPVCALFQEVPG